MGIVLIEREINYFELDFTFIKNQSLATFFETLTKLAKTKAKIRYQRFGDKYIFIQGISNKDGIINAKIRCIRLDLFPEIINMTTDEITEIEGAETDGIVETTHFIIDYRKKKTILAIEYNHHGSKIGDLINYIQRIGINQDSIEKVGFTAIVNKNLLELKERLNRISEFSMKIHKDYLSDLKKMDGQIFQSATASTNQFENEYAILEYKINYRTFTDTPKIKNSINNIIDYLILNPNKRNMFNYLHVRGEDEKNNNLLETFDLLLDKISSSMKVQRKEKQKTIISEDMFQKMLIEINRLKFI